MVASEVEEFLHVMKRTVHRQLGDKGAVSHVIAAKRRHVAENRHPNDTIDVIASLGVEEATEALDWIGDISCQGIIELVGDGALIIDKRRPGMRESDLRPGIERIDAALKQVWGIEVVVGHPFEELAASLFNDKIVIK